MCLKCMLLYRFGKLLLQVLTTQAFADDFTFTIYQEVHWNALHAIKLCSAVLPSFKVRHMRPGQVVFFYSFHPFVFLIVERHAENVEAFIMVMLISFYNG